MAAWRGDPSRSIVVGRLDDVGPLDAADVNTVKAATSSYGSGYASMRIPMLSLRETFIIACA